MKDVIKDFEQLLEDLEVQTNTVEEEIREITKTRRNLQKLVKKLDSK